MWEKTRIETIENSYKSNTKLFFEKANEVKNGFKPRIIILLYNNNLGHII